MGEWTILGSYFFGITVLSACVSSMPTVDPLSSNGNHTPQSNAKVEDDAMMQLTLKNLRSLEQKTREEFKKVNKTGNAKMDEESYRKFFLGMVLGSNWWDWSNPSASAPRDHPQFLPPPPGLHSSSATDHSVVKIQQVPSTTHFDGSTPSSVDISISQVADGSSLPHSPSSTLGPGSLSTLSDGLELTAEFDSQPSLRPDPQRPFGPVTYRPSTGPPTPESTTVPESHSSYVSIVEEGDIPALTEVIVTDQDTTSPPRQSETSAPSSEWIVEDSGQQQVPDVYDYGQSSSHCHHKHHRPRKTCKSDFTKFLVLLARLDPLPPCSRPEPVCPRKCRRRHQQYSNQLDLLKKYLSQWEDDAYDTYAYDY